MIQRLGMTTIIEPKKSVIGKIVEPVSHGADLSEGILEILGTIVRTSSVPKFMINRNHRVIAWNRALEEFTGIKDKDALGTAQHWKAYYNVKRPCLADLLVDESFGNLKIWFRDKCTRSVHADEAYEVTDLFPHMGNGGKWLHVTAVPIRDSSGTVIAAVESLEDVTEQKLPERALKLSNKKLHLMNSIAWHDIQNKITSIRGYVELSKDVIQDEKGITYVEAEEIILKQIHELLKYTMEYQKIGTLPPRWVNIRDAIHSVSSLMETGPLYMELDVDDLELFGDPTLEMLFSLLIKNTLKNKKTEPEIRLNFAEKKEGLQLTYEDNSAGIPYSRKKSLFTEDIVKADNFCMKFVHDILEFSGMSIKETGKPDRGARFEIMVPEGAYRFVKTQDKS